MKEFYCNNGRLMCFLKFYGISWLDSGFNEEKKEKYWIFAKDDDLAEAIALYHDLIRRIPKVDNQNKITKYRAGIKENENVSKSRNISN